MAERALHWYESGDREAAFGSVLAAARQVEEGGNFDLQARWWGRALELWGGSLSGMACGATGRSGGTSSGC